MPPMNDWPSRFWPDLPKSPTFASAITSLTAAICPATQSRAMPSIELRNDLIETPAQQTAWALRLAPILQEVAAQTGL